ncbi:MAG: GUN4 domain-containing protein [Oscillatoria sp. PMC 1051.18]|nr:GUN4 domain-containing protein [Oscillatoria sp. PMC 1050.18]MEC5028862.1 GUN4 domain-containing protein [Oscillatoria sp. PMC 1051.18]
MTLLNNRYQILQTLGRGGFGETFLAEDSQMPSNRRCVIKKLKPQNNNPQIYQLVKDRFAREAAILEDLGDKNKQIPCLYAYFEFSGEFYLVQEWISGVTLTQKLQQEGTLSESSVKEILIGILPVLDYLHSKRIVHRDIKPDNIILRAENNQPVLIDFGAVKETMGTIATASGNPVSSIVIGTPGFMSVEQNAGRPVYSSDLFSLGLTAIYLLTGKLPEELPTDPATGEIIWRQYALSVSPSLAGVLEKAIKFHWRDRYSTAAEMFAALQAKPLPNTQISPPPLPQNTQISPPPPTPQSLTQPKPSFPEWAKILLVSSVVSGCGLIGLVLLRQENTPTIITEGTIATEEAIAESPVPTQENFTPKNTSLPSDAGVDYGNLQDLLSIGRLQQADGETSTILRQLASESAQLRPQDINNIPCTDLRTINQLWQEYSDGKFGFSIQRQIWQENGRNTDLFRSQVGWRVNGKAIDYDNHNFSFGAPRGHLPSVRSLNHNFLLPRISNCGL